MLRQLRMENYRCFEDHTILLEPNAVLVGRNNAGKSSIIEALRIVATVVNRKGAAFVTAPPWLDLSRFQVGIAPGISELGLNLSAVFHRYHEPPAIITATFREGGVVTICRQGREGICNDSGRRQLGDDSHKISKVETAMGECASSDRSASNRGVPDFRRARLRVLELPIVLPTLPQPAVSNE